MHGGDGAQVSGRAANALIGSPVERLEDLRLLRGKGEYVGDVVLGDLLHAVLLRSSVAHGRIRGIDAAAALKRAGVHAVITAAEIGTPVPRIPFRLDALPEFEPFQQPVIAEDKVRYVGEPVAIVVADTAELAEDALDSIVLDIEPLPPVVDRAGARRGDSLLVESGGKNVTVTLTAIRGDADAAFARAPYTRKETFAVQRHTAVPMETRGFVAGWDAANERLTVYGAAKAPWANRRILAKQMDLPEHSIHMVENDVGGGFGVRGEFYPEDFLIPFTARFMGRPIKWIEDRREALMTTNHARDVECTLEIACERDGTILAVRGEACTDLGAYVRTNGATGSRNLVQALTGPYRIPDVHITVSPVVTNKTPVGTYRGPGRFEGDFFRERLLDIVAADLKLDRIEFRRRNLVPEAEMPYPLATLLPFRADTACDSGDYQITLDRCLKEFDWAGKQALDGRQVDGRYHGVALGCYIEGGASGPSENARLAVENDGRISVYIGASGVGQGVETTFAQIAADALELPMQRIGGVFHGSTDYLDNGFGSFGSRSVVMGGSAVIDAAGKLREQIRAAAARHFGCAAEDVSLVDGMVVGPGGQSVGFGALAGEELAADGHYSSNKRTYSYGAHAAHVAVDAGTGQVELIDYVAVEDVGRIINPLTLHGQTMGAIVQGLGGAFMEHMIYDENGQLLTGTLADYLMPTASDFPCIRAFAMEEKPSPNNPLGAKGAGEGGIIPVGGVIANAVASALAAFGVQPHALPLSPPRVWHLIDDARRTAGKA